MVDRANINDMTTLIEIKNSLRSKFPNLMTNVLKLTLIKEEERIACIITAYYELSLE